MKPLVGIIMGSESDLPVMADAVKTLKQLQVPWEICIISAHRTPARAEEYAKNAEARGIEVIIAAAGGAAHLAGVIAAWTVLPVIGVPIRSSFLEGLDSLLSMVQMPAGVPVGVVGINSARNAAILAAQILALADPQLRERLKHFRQAMTEEVAAKSSLLADIGLEAYLEGMKKV
ncbi:MAG: 5-(carboxyamino)imidazole ribonucleotide mutase [Syntrophomonadaceae bacterium]|jgi:5-(carboxyamino)imidazole ribonucleotide mutase|nr:5-(carboxyamino)imidazole ribonucleotide mutase [Syntrophomonadaceae bacterium]